MEDVAVHDEDHAQEYLDEDDGHGVEIEYDEHIWTSPVNAKKLVGVLAEVLEQVCWLCRDTMTETWFEL